jgi:rod shape-determining protein MreD
VIALLGWLRVPLVLILALVLQVSLLSEFRIAGAHADLVVVIALACAMVAGAQVGAIVAFAAGLLVDLTVTTPFGLTALAYCLVAWGLGRVLTGVLHPVWWVPPLALAAGAAVEVGLYALLAAVVGRTELLDTPTLEAMAVVAGFALVLSPAAVRVARLTLSGAVDLRA